MALLHLKPLPKAICQTRSPRRTPLRDSMFASTYQMLLELVLPNLRPARACRLSRRSCAVSAFAESTGEQAGLLNQTGI